MQYITYPHECAAQVADIVDLHRLSRLKVLFNQCHKELYERPNRVTTLKEYSLYCKCPAIKEELNIALRDRSDLITIHLNEPTFRCFEYLEQAKIPVQGSSIFTTNATADSAHLNPIAAILTILGKYDDYKWEHTSNINTSGYTGVSCKKPRDASICFDAHTPLEKWPELTWDMAQQMFEKSGKKHEKYDHIYHWGCISQNWTKNPLGNYVSNWGLHEKWNHVNTIAMIWHAIATLKPGGQLMLKVRIWKAAEIIGICALIAPMFSSYSIIGNAKQACSFACIIYNDYNPVHRETVLNVVKECMNYRLAYIFGNSWYESNMSICQDFIQQAEMVKDEMMQHRALTSTCFLVCLHAIHQVWRRKNKRVLFQTVKPMLSDAYGNEQGEYLFQELIRVSHNMTHDEYVRLDTVMSSNWMFDNV